MWEMRMFWIVVGTMLGVVPTANVCAGEDESPAPDCGVHALYILLSLEGKSLTMSDLKAVLPKPDDRGYSLLELSEAAKKLGTKLDGIRLSRQMTGLDRPAIVFLSQDELGHFAVVRPVGTTGKMVQVIDPPHPPEILDFDQLANGEAWSGRALVVRRVWRPTLIECAIALFGGGLVCAAAWWFGTVPRRAARRRADVPAGT